MNDKYKVIQTTIQMLNNVQTAGANNLQNLLGAIQNLVDLYNAMQDEDRRRNEAEKPKSEDI